MSAAQINAQSASDPTYSKAALTKKPLALRPPLGWNSYDSYKNSIGEEETLKNLEIFARKLATHGYEYFVIDYGWYNEDSMIPGSIRPWFRQEAPDWALDGNGYPISSRTYFPNGIKRIADRAHQLGVKFGLHLFRGVIRKAWDFNLPIKGSSARIKDISDTKAYTDWNDVTYGVEMSKDGAHEYYTGLIQHLADLGVDMIKCDDLVPYPAEVEAIGRAVASCERDMLLSLSPGDDTTPANKNSYKWGHMLRITNDIWDSHQCLDDCFARWRVWQGSAGPGFWPDMDMLCLGTLTGYIDPVDDHRRDLTPEQLGTMDLEDVFFRKCHFSTAQERTFLSMRALSASPLFMGGCLIRSEQRVLDLITAPDMLKCNQNGISGTLQSETGQLEVWRTPNQGDETQGWIGVFNRSETETSNPTLTLKDFGLPDGRYQFRECWTHQPIEISKQAVIGADDVLFLEYKTI